MTKSSSSKSLLTRAVQLSLAIFINKPIGFLRDILRVRYMGIGLTADAFSMAWRTPNAFRRIFGEGALSSVLVPTLVHLQSDTHDKQKINQFITLLLIFFQAGVFVLCACMAYYARSLLILMAPGALDRVALAIPMFQILIFFILLMSGSVILGSALQLKHNFLIGPYSQFVVNIALCLQFGLGNYWGLSLVKVSWMMLGNGFIIAAMHLYSYYKQGFSLNLPVSPEAWHHAGIFFRRFLPVFLSAGMSEINLLVDQAMASFLPTGSQSMFDCISNFIRFPLQVFGSSFATVSGPHFAEIAKKNPRRLMFHVLESMKFMFWTTSVATICFIIFSYKILQTTLLSKKFTMLHVEQGAYLMRIFSFIIFFSVINRVLINVYYALQETSVPSRISMASTIINVIFTALAVLWGGLPGIIAATVLVEAIRTSLLLYFLWPAFNMALLMRKFFAFCWHVLAQLGIISLLTTVLYVFSDFLLSQASPRVAHLFRDTFLYWFWVGPLLLLGAFLLFKTRKRFGINLYFLKHL